MPLYDCGAPDCSECQTAFGPDRSKAIANYDARGRSYYLHDLPPEDNEKIDAAWKRHIAVVPASCIHDPVLDDKSGIHVCSKCGRGVNALRRA